MARIRALKEDGGRAVTLWTPRKAGRPPAMALWEVTVSLGKDSRGRWRQRSERLRGTYTLAKARAAEMETKLGRVSPDDAPEAVNEVLDAYIAYAESTKRRASKTIVGYQSIARTVEASLLGNVKLRRVNADDLDSYYTWLTEGRGVSARTVAHHHMLLSQAFNMAIRRKWLAAPNPAGNADPPSPAATNPTAPAPEDARFFIRAFASRPETVDKAALLLLAGITGCRRGEVVGWRFSDFDQEAGALVVRRSITMAKGGPQEKGTKTNRERRLAVSTGTVAVLAAQWDRYASGCRDFGIVPDLDSYVFSGQVDHSKPLNPNSVTQAFGRLRTREVAKLRASGDIELVRRAARLEQVKLGHLRHFAATEMAGGGIDLKTASARMGHDGAVFMRHYAAVIDVHDQEAGALLESLLLPALALPAAPGA
jgi:integrase